MKGNQVKLPWSFRIRQAWELIVHGTDTRYDQALTIIEEQGNECAREEGACLQALAERDCYHDWADKLAQAIAEHTGEEIGEHSSANNPWANALGLIDGQRCR